jgi:predicted NAD/FAD-binding protein
MTSALWSAAPGRALELPAAYGIQFFRTHSMLGLRRHRWRTVAGGSYICAVLDG